ncbi:DNA polymerase III subunit gamma/tau [Buchnera aphidicola (Aphis craccivora)]|uniref:DNA polymerase III subunit gamma/tau n=1 Tax=Buchnera aphidicola (Aphis craccivora) TaxID=466616 RepID=A0A4D6XHP2_9GAMM|nr:DNA polymerase III subunit gamma/tau [Buchnera aphidicola]QCI16706.1 DNA polymerase III subunit gamma/tau [Buchnera aphidicola (Aphis craccivora)]QLL40839.1 DNA polymerase III subunit gamma/tau [Buchnera aphidicola (Aphis craccivore)]WAI17681.1 MAG: DNA polymerase III subunit gamma/tau [Buchnera aphidicola (Aphis craccivora)]
MNYQILARKYRPQYFKETIGQKHIITSICNAISMNKIHHAWLLSGTRGIGKTTIGRLLAKSLNCQKNITSIPCRKCNICKEIEQGTSLDFIEIDAASRTKIEDMKEILDNIYYAPIKSRFKIYLIDEVHMLSRHSFNALLKTLEEPPKHVKFILATTEIEKIPKTIISRCLYFTLNILSEEDIFDHLQFILNNENIDFDKDALKIISEYSKGSMRDALNLLEHAISFSKNNITLNNINKMLGIPNKKNIYLLTKFLLEKDAKKMMLLLSKMEKIDIEWENILIEVLRILHHIAMIKTYPLEWNSNIYKHYQYNIEELAHKKNKKDIQICYRILLNGRKKLIFSPNYKIGVKMTLLEAITEIKKNIYKK